MKIKKNKFDSYCVNGFTKGCKYCVKGKKLVLFVTGICNVNCWYCSLSKKRKNKNLIFANERECKNFEDIAEEVRESKATSAGITGGDPLACLDKTIKFASELKKEFGKKFHIHIYLPTKFTTKEKLEKLSGYIDEVRFHPEFLINKSKIKEDVEKIKTAEKIFGRKNTGIELPMIPEKKKEILDFILNIEKFISFVNLNEFELSETNFNIVTKKYSLNEGGYVVSESLKAGKWILNELAKTANRKLAVHSSKPNERKTKLKVHLCTAELKNCSQFANRLKRHKILPYGKKTKDGTVIYLVINKRLDLKGTFYDEKKKRTILSEKVARKLLGKEKIIRVEEYPTYDRIEVESEEL